MSQPIPDGTPCILLVEGNDETHFFQQFCTE
jgi:hypothetical protein